MKNASESSECWQREAHETQYERQLCIARGRHYDDRLEWHSFD